MENASKALLIAGAILLCILIIAIGMYIYNNAQSTVTESLNSLSTQEIEAYNNQFLLYDGLQDGTKLKNLMAKLIANANVYKDENTKIPGVYIEQDEIVPGENFIHASVPEDGRIQEYVNLLGNIRNRIQTKHDYWVEMSYQKNGLIDYITITYDPEEPSELTYRDNGPLPPM